MAAPMEWEKGRMPAMQNNRGGNSFRPRHNVHQNRFQQNISCNNNFEGNRPTFTPQFNRFSRPNFTPPTQPQHNTDSKGYTHQTEQSFTASNNNNMTPNYIQQNMPTQNFMTTEQMRTRPPFHGRINSPTNHQHFRTNDTVPQPPQEQMFNPNFPPPMLQSFTGPPPGGQPSIRPNFDQQNVFPKHQHQPQTPMHGGFPQLNEQGKNGQSVIEDAISLQRRDKQRRDASQKAEDVEWVTKWIHDIAKKHKAGKDETLTVSKAQEKTRHMIVLLAKLQKGKQNLESMKNEDKTVWEQKLKEVLQIKAEVESYHKELTNEEMVMALKKKVDKRRKKREGIKRRKMAEYERLQAELMHREEVQAQFDKNLHQVIEKQRIKKQEDEMKKEADQILGQVRKKISDANKTIQVLNGVQKVRTLRKDRLARQGILSMYEPPGGSSGKSLTFESKITDMVSLLNTQLETYKSEEETLKVILETEQEETREKEREKALQKQLEKQKRMKVAEYKMLFGNQKDPKPGDPLYPFWQFYCMAENNLEALVSIRQAWDTYLTLPNTPYSTCIPTDWVIPPEPSSDTWNTAIQDGVS